jgi:hypothetical protein
MKAAGCADGKLLSRCRVLKALKAVSRPYRIVVSSRTLASGAERSGYGGLGCERLRGLREDGRSDAYQ